MSSPKSEPPLTPSLPPADAPQIPTTSTQEASSSQAATSQATPPQSNTSQRRASTRLNQSPRDRIDSILSSARQRKVAMDSLDDNEPLSSSRSGERGRDGREEVESSADEETSIFRRRSSGGSLNYQGTAREGNKSREREGRGRNGRKAPGAPGAPAPAMEENQNQNENENEEGGGVHQAWWARLLSEYGSIELENKGSVARDHLALERTFLAWLRTSLAFASIGIAITQLFRLNTTSASSDGADPYKHLRQMGKPLGATFLGISIVMLGVGFHRYFEGQHWIIRGKFPASRGSIALVAAVTFALMITSLVVVLAVEPGSYEK